MNTLRRPMSCLLVLVLLLGLTACGGKPSKMSDFAYEKGKTAVEIAEDYLNGMIDAKTAAGKLERIEKSLEKQKNSGDFPDHSVWYYVWNLEYDISRMDSAYSTNTTQDVRDDLAKLKKTLNMK